MNDETWNIFEATGKVDDYLTYRYTEKSESKEDSCKGGNTYGTDHCTYGNGITDDAHK